ncbi:MAG: NAD(P)H-dependent oxidoreductase [Rhodobacteraceae bacterium]|nr:NAD(P)H-dependent oxidoreductase [Paracoccaceae bacterium]
MKIVAFGASTSSTSINKSLAAFAASLAKGAEVEILDLNDFEIPLFSEDAEMKLGQPQAAQEFLNKIKSADGVIVSFAEHNGSYTAAYKNLFDWASRIDQKVYQDKPTVFLATSPGAGGAGSVLAAAKASAPFFGVDLKAAVSVKSFYQAFDAETQSITDPVARAELESAVHHLTDTLRVAQ